MTSSKMIVDVSRILLAFLTWNKYESVLGNQQNRRVFSNIYTIYIRINVRIVAFCSIWGKGVMIYTYENITLFSSVCTSCFWYWRLLLPMQTTRMHFSIAHSIVIPKQRTVVLFWLCFDISPGSFRLQAIQLQSWLYASGNNWLCCIRVALTTDCS